MITLCLIFLIPIPELPFTEGITITAGTGICEYFNILYNNFQKIQTDINDEIKIKVDAINNAAQEIASLNSQINTIEVGGLNKANDLRDKRDLVIDNLSKIIDVEYKEKKTKKK